MIETCCALAVKRHYSVENVHTDAKQPKGLLRDTLSEALGQTGDTLHVYPQVRRRPAVFRRPRKKSSQIQQSAQLHLDSCALR
jgi:hypothetical protein